MAKIIPAILIIAIIVPSLLLPQRVQAGLFSGIVDFFTGGFGSLGQVVLDTGVEILKKRLLDMIVDQIIVSIEGGREPLFIQDWRSFFAQYANIATGDLVQALGLGAVCRPFGIQLQLAVLRPPLFSNQITCTMDQIVGNVINFYDDFRAGGFIAYRELWNPQNNFYGALLLAMNEQEQRVAAELFAASQEAIAGAGYLGVRKCVQGPYGRFCYIQTPGTQVGAMAAKAWGSKIDWLINIHDFSGYVAAITDALINRLIREGVFALKSYAQELPSSRELLGHDQDQGGFEPCRNLSGQFREQCLVQQAARANDLTVTKRALIGQINTTLNPLTVAEASIQEAVSRQTTLVEQLTQLRDCQIGRGQSGKDQTISHLAKEESDLAQLKQQLTDVNQITTPLVNARAHLQNPPDNNPYTLVTIFTEIELLLNAEQAQEIKRQNKEQLEATEAKVSRRLPEVKQQTERCANT